MARKKIKLAWIVDDASRKATYRKRTKGLVKKVGELSILCGVEAAVVVTGPYKPQPEVWPPVEAANTFLKFKKLPEMEQRRKMMNQERFFRQRTEKLNEQSTNLAKKNQDTEIDAIMYECLSTNSLERVTNVSDLDALTSAIDARAKEVQERIHKVRDANWLCIK